VQCGKVIERGITTKVQYYISIDIVVIHYPWKRGKKKIFTKYFAVKQYNE